jgi:hypothetical protein
MNKKTSVLPYFLVGSVLVIGVLFYLNFQSSTPIIPLPTCANESHALRASGECTVYPHIKLFSFPLNQYNSPAPDVWRAQHNDVAFFHTNFRQYALQANLDIKPASYLLTDGYVPYDVANITNWYCPQYGCDPEDAFYHYKQDLYGFRTVIDGAVNLKGFNPNRTSFDAPATAANISEARMMNHWSKNWLQSNYNSSIWYGFTKLRLLDRKDQGNKAVLVDNAQEFPPGHLGLNYTYEYYGVPLNGSHPIIAKNFENLNNLERETGLELIRNLGATYWYFNPYDSTKKEYESGKKSFLMESWMNFMREDSVSSDSANYEYSYKWSNILADRAERLGQKFYLQAYVSDAAFQKGVPAGERKKMFFLSAFYLFNNDNLYFSFLDANFAPLGTQTPNDEVEFVKTQTWIPAIEYDVGKPIVNHFGLPDFNGTMNSNKNFVWSNGTDPISRKKFYVIGREYTNALVLVKWRPIGANAVDGTATTHLLDGNYSVLNYNGSFVGIVDRVSLRNSEGVILKKV